MRKWVGLCVAGLSGALALGASQASAAVLVNDMIMSRMLPSFLQTLDTPPMTFTAGNGMVNILVPGNLGGADTPIPPPKPDFTPNPSAALVTSVPEPASWSLMILGLGGVGGALRRGRALRRSAA